jgi:glycosyltransferase involved in cell wall biosynthesis
MRVLHIIPSISRKRGGPSTAIFSMVKALQQEAIDASIITTCDYGSYIERKHPINSWFSIDGVPVLVFPSVSCFSRGLNEYLFSPNLSWWLIRNITSFDLVHIHAIFSYSSTSSMLIARMKGVPYVIRTIGQLNSWSLSQGRLKKFFMLSLIEKKNLMRSLAIHVTSASEMEDVRDICDHPRILKLELGVNLPDISLEAKVSAGSVIRFLFLSRIHPKKQLHSLLDALSRLKKAAMDRPWCLLVAGDGEDAYIGHLKRLAEEYDISEQINWLGHVDGTEKDQLLRSSDWFVLPSITENFGISAVEALSYGVPVILSKDVGISEMVKSSNAGLVYGSGSVRLTAALNIALRGAPMNMRIAARKLAEEQFSWSCIGHKLTVFYQRHLIKD